MHTTWSDGSLPLEEMVEAARSLGRTFVAVTDHSEALAIANGMTAAELAEQGRVIDAMNRGFEEEGDAFRVLRSMEVDLFPDGTIDMDDDSLASLDLVLGAFHSELRSKDDQTERYLAALRQPRLHVLAHPKARMYGRRVGLVADWRRVFAEAAIQGKALELDATVPRQDLNVELATIAREEGVEWFTIGSDAHSAPELEFLPFGMAIAALAGIPRERILNYQPTRVRPFVGASDARLIDDGGLPGDVAPLARIVARSAYEWDGGGTRARASGIAARGCRPRHHARGSAHPRRDGADGSGHHEAVRRGGAQGRASCVGCRGGRGGGRGRAGAETPSITCGWKLAS